MVSVELCWPTVSVVSFIFVKFRSSKRALIWEKNWNQNFLWICTSTHYVLHYYKVSGNSVEPFQRSCANKLCWVISFIFAQFLSSKRTLFREKKWNQNFLWICASTHYDIHIYKVSRNSVERFQRSCANKKNSSIFPFCQISKFKKGVTPRKKLESKFPVDMHIYTLCPSLLQSFR